MTNHQASTPVAMLLFGMAAGAVGALLFAPRSGRETREMMKEKGKQWHENAMETTDKVADKVEAGIAKSTDKLNETAGKVMDKTESGRLRAKQKLNDMNNEASAFGA